jgi:hypothetical protein
MADNQAFIAKAIDRANGRMKGQCGLAAGEPLCDAITAFLIRRELLVWDDYHALFWVRHPTEGWQVAVWMMPVANQFQPQ